MVAKITSKIDGLDLPLLGSILYVYTVIIVR